MTLRGARFADRYELAREVAQDGDATIWEGYDSALARRVSIRVLRPALAGDSAAVERFTGSARAAARVGVRPGERVLDAGRDPDTALPFVVYEWTGDTPPGVVEPPTQPINVSARPRRTMRRRRPPVAALLLLIPVVAGAVIVRGVLDLPSPSLSLPSTPLLPTAAVATPATAVPTARPATATARPAQAAPTATPQISGVRKHIVNTDGIGVALRSSPGGPRLPGKGYDEGATVTLLEQDGTWAHIRGDDGREGWVLAVTVG